jgi:hypothetical protein
MLGFLNDYDRLQIAGRCIFYATFLNAVRYIIHLRDVLVTESGSDPNTVTDAVILGFVSNVITIPKGVAI